MWCLCLPRFYLHLGASHTDLSRLFFFQAGKLSDEVMGEFLNELDVTEELTEGEAQEYARHAIVLRNTLRFLRYNGALWGSGPGDAVLVRKRGACELSRFCSCATDFLIILPVSKA